MNATSTIKKNYYIGVSMIELPSSMSRQAHKMAQAYVDLSNIYS